MTRRGAFAVALIALLCGCGGTVDVARPGDAAMSSDASGAGSMRAESSVGIEASDATAVQTTEGADAASPMEGGAGGEELLDAARDVAAQGDATLGDATVADATVDDAPLDAESLLDSSPDASGADVADGGLRACNGGAPAYGGIWCLNGEAFNCNTDGVWTPACACFCTPTGWVCGNGLLCEEGQTQCVGNAVETCTGICGGTWSPPVECVDSQCVSGACSDETCTPGMSRCSGNNVQACDATGKWSDLLMPCTNQVCLAGACTGSCTPGNAECVGNTLLTCTSDGTWGSPINCCGDCASGSCSGPGETRCSGNGVETCQSDGNWGAPVECTGQTCVYGVCQCTTGATQCSDGVQQICTQYNYWEPVTCDAGDCDGGIATCAIDAGGAG